MRLRISLVLLTVFVALFLLPSPAPAHWNRMTTVIFDRPVQIPGAVLPAGIYVFKLADINDRNVVQIWNEDQTKLYATVMALPQYRDEPPAEHIFILEEKQKDQPAQLKSWFHEGNQSGGLFVYPKEPKKPRG